MALTTWEDPALISSLQETLHLSLPHWVSEQPLSRADLSCHGMEMSDRQDVMLVFHPALLGDREPASHPQVFNS